MIEKIKRETLLALVPTTTSATESQTFHANEHALVAMHQSSFKWMTLNEEQPIFGAFRLVTEHPYFAGRLPTFGPQVQLCLFIYSQYKNTHSH